MARASFHTARPFRLLGLALGLALAAALLVPGVLGQNREKKDEGKKAEAKKEAAKKDEPKKAEPRPALAPGLEPRVADTIQMINKKLEAAWEENKLTPAKACDDFEFIRRASLDII